MYCKHICLVNKGLKGSCVLSCKEKTCPYHLTLMPVVQPFHTPLTPLLCPSRRPHVRSAVVFGGFRISFDRTVFRQTCRHSDLSTVQLASVCGPTGSTSPASVHIQYDNEIAFNSMSYELNTSPSAFCVIHVTVSPLVFKQPTRLPVGME